MGTSKLLRALFATALLACAAPAWASYTFDGTNDQLQGTLTTQLGNPVTLACWVKHTQDGTQDTYLQLGDAAASDNDSYKVQTGASFSAYRALSVDSLGASVSTTRTSPTNYDATWVAVVAVHDDDATGGVRKSVFVGTIDNTNTNNAAVTIANTLDDVSIGEDLDGGNDINALLGHCALWNIVLSTQNITDYLAGANPAGIAAANLRAYYPMITNTGATVPNDGLDATGDLTATGNAAFNADNPPVNLPAFDSAPDVTAQTTTVYTSSYDANANATNFYAAAYLKDAATPTCGAVKVGTGAIATATEATTGAADSLNLTIPGDPLAVNDLHYCLAGSTGDSAVFSQLDEFLDAPTGRQYFTKSGAPTGSQLGMFDGASPAAVDGDVADVDTLVDSADRGVNIHALTASADTTFIIDSDGDLSRLTFTRRFQDVSGTAWSEASAVTYYVNDRLQTFVGLTPEEGEDPFLFEVSVALSFALDEFWTDAEGDTLTHAVVNPPTGTTATSEVWSGTPSTCGVFNTVEFESTSATTAFAEKLGTNITIGAKVPNVVNLTEAAAITAIETTAPCDLDAVAGAASYHATIVSGNVISTDFAAGTLVIPTQVVTYVKSLGPAPAVTVQKHRFGVGKGISL